MAEMTRLWYLIRVSKKYGLDTREFLMRFPDALTHEKSAHNGISIQLRQKTEDNCVFLVTQGQKVIAQLHLSQKLLKYLPEVDPASFPFIEFTPNSRIETLETSDLQIKDIDAKVRFVNLKARVVGKSIPRCVFSRFGDALTVSTATISDGTGCMRMSLWNAEIDRVSIGDTVQIENGQVRTFRGELQVSLGRNGRLQVVENQSMKQGCPEKM
jgi:replication factor A1